MMNYNLEVVSIGILGLDEQNSKPTLGRVYMFHNTI